MGRGNRQLKTLATAPNPPQWSPVWESEIVYHEDTAKNSHKDYQIVVGVNPQGEYAAWSRYGRIGKTKSKAMVKDSNSTDMHQTIKAAQKIWRSKTKPGAKGRYLPQGKTASFGECPLPEQQILNALIPERGERLDELLQGAVRSDTQSLAETLLGARRA